MAKRNDQPTMTRTSQRDNCVIIFVGQVLIPFGMTLIFNWIAGWLAYPLCIRQRKKIVQPQNCEQFQKCWRLMFTG